MKYLFSILAILIIATNAIAQDVSFSNKLIEKYQIGRNQLKSTNSVYHDRFWLTPLLLEAKQNWSKLTIEAKDLFGEIIERPKFIGTEKIATYSNFAFHYSIDGPAGESVDKTDLDKSGIPDYVEDMAFIFGDSINSLYHKTTKLALPPNDKDKINDAYYDVYITGNKADEIGQGTYGYVAPETTIGDNPNSPGITETNASTSFMVMRNNYTGFSESQEISISVTAAHEYMHAVQMGYDANMNPWFMEAVSAWAEEFSFPGYDDNFQYLTDVFSKTDIALNYENGQDSENAGLDGHWYSSWLFVKYLTEHTNPNIIRNIYERCVSKNSINALDQVLKDNWNSDFEKMFLQYTIANSLLGSDHKFTPYTYERASDYYNQIEVNSLMKYEGEFEFTGQEINFNSQTEGNDTLMRLSYENYLMTSNNNFKIEFLPSSSINEVDIILIKCSLKNGTSIQTPTYSGNVSNIEVTDNSKWDYYIPVVVRFGKDVTNIDPADYILSIKKGNTTGIEEFKSANNIYPNPSNDKIFVNIGGLNSELVNVDIIDLTGKKVLNKQINNNSFIDVSKILTGIYILRIYNEQGEISKTKQIIN